MKKLVHVLMVDDDEGDIQLTKECLLEAKIRIDLSVVNDGEQCMEFLRRQGKYSDAQLPDVILLDLNMPKKDGRQTLEEIRADKVLKAIPVVILTTSDADQDIVESYTKGANSYVKKPVDFEQYRKIVSEISDFWFEIVALPKVNK
ncbi:MAG: response regulator [Candidatus Omnitrophota bacterium]